MGRWHNMTQTTGSSLRWLGSDFLDRSYGWNNSYDILGKGGVTLSGNGGVVQGLRLASTVRHPADINLDWHVNYFDISEFIRLFAAGDDRVDFRLDGNFDIDDVRVFLGLMDG